MSPTWNPLSTEPPSCSWGVNFGGGVNSTAVLLILHERGLRPDWVLFSDTGSERPETYENVQRVAQWSKDVGFPFETVRWIRKDGSFESIHDNALRTKYLPSKAYGYSGCTWKWKIQPMAKWRKANGFERSVVVIGYDAGEKRRVGKVKKACEDTERDPSLDLLWYPLVAWGVNRDDCTNVIAKMGWPTVKSACFLCPHMRAEEWQALKAEHPDLFNIALRVESGAKKAGNAKSDSASLFRSVKGDCLCLADACLVPDAVVS